LIIIYNPTGIHSNQAGGRRSLFHEYTHRFLEHSLGGSPYWFNEGMAEVFSTYYEEGKNGFLGAPVKSHMALLWTIGEKEFSLENLFSKRPDSFVEKGLKEMFLFYSQSWAFTHFCMYSGDFQYRDKLFLFVGQLMEEREASEAFQSVFRMSYEEFEEIMRKNWEKGEFALQKISLEGVKKPPEIRFKKAKKNDVIRMKAFAAIIGNGELEFAHKALKKRAKKSSDPQNWSLLGLSEYSEGDLDKASEYYQMAFSLIKSEKDVHPAFYLEFAEVSIRKSIGENNKLSQKEAEFAFDLLSKAIRNGLNQASAFVAVSMIFNYVDNGEGVARSEVLKGGLERYPSNYYIAYQLAGLKLQSGLLDEAMEILRKYEGLTMPYSIRKAFSHIRNDIESR
jgi:tetratricopeptide (TPR) repeat protein